AAAEVPLCVDLDGTLLVGDSLHELVLACIAKQPFLLFLMPLWLLRGKAALKDRLARAMDPSGLSFIFHLPFLDFLQGEKARGRRLVLATAADHRVAEAVAARTGLFEEVLATRPGHNLRGATKAEALVARFGARGFDYAGNDRHDLPVWAMARRAIVVAPARSGIAARAAALAPVERVFHTTGLSPRPLLRAMRPHQWAKNALVFLPVIAAHRLSDGPAMWNALLAFIALSLVASAGYMVNDLLDLQADRLHPRKRRRPFASGDLPVPAGPAAILALLGTGFAIAAAVSWALAAWIALYLALSLTYSTWLKRKVLIDVFVLAGLYTHRILAGAIASLVAPSFWLLALSNFLFLSLAMLKRYSELVGTLSQATREERPGGRGYRIEDLDTLGALGAASGFSAVFVLALYIESENVRILYRTPEVFWLCCPLLLYWISRMWIGARRGKIDDDPLVFALRDRVSLMVLSLLLVLAAISATVDVRCLFLGICG
ncbi:MAG TPA: UbiA family prenyltransferase, partial [Quisquiliibacterium sp.]|nr:UbiA family prenyltransferase [Quisquiliibacterium sp.]